MRLLYHVIVSINNILTTNIKGINMNLDFKLTGFVLRFTTKNGYMSYGRCPRSGEFYGIVEGKKSLRILNEHSSLTNEEKQFYNNLMNNN
jgi:hypothetical protein